jgi:HTH-type transcriptional regulator/antitoxin MqsA
MMHIDCRYCGEGQMAEESYDRNIKNGRATLSVAGLLHWRCSVCDSIMTDSRQLAFNCELVSEAESKAVNFVSKAMLREFREKFGLSQREAGKLIGAGEAAFGKYESGARLSAPTAKLIRVALAIPEVAQMLAIEEGMAIDMPVSREIEQCSAQAAAAGEWVASSIRWTPNTSHFHGGKSTHQPPCDNDEFFFPENLPRNAGWTKHVMVM